MPIVDTDYTAFVVWGYSIGAAGLLGVLAWTVLRLRAAQKRLAEAEKDETR